MADPKPSLTPHRDAVERVIAQLDRGGPTDPWLNRFMRRTVEESSRALADIMDEGVSRQDIAMALPIFMRCLAMNSLTVVGLTGTHAAQQAPCLLLAACEPQAEPSGDYRAGRLAAGHAGGRA